MARITVSKVKSYWKEHGTLGLAKKAVVCVCSPFFAYHPLDFYCISGSPKAQLQSRCPLEIRKGSTEDTTLIDDMLKDTYESAESTVRKGVKRWFDSGGEVFLAFSEAKLVHVAWLHYCPGVREVYPHVKIEKDEAYIGQCDTHPEFRGKNIYPVALQHISGYAVSRNKKRCFITTTPKHVASIKGIEKAGFSFVGKLRRFRFFGKMLNNQWVSSKLLGPE